MRMLFGIEIALIVCGAVHKINIRYTNHESIKVEITGLCLEK